MYVKATLVLELEDAPKDSTPLGSPCPTRSHTFPGRDLKLDNGYALIDGLPVSAEVGAGIQKRRLLQATVRLVGDPPLVLQVQALLQSESTPQEDFASAKLLVGQADYATLEERVRAYGQDPHLNERKYPRIPIEVMMRIARCSVAGRLSSASAEDPWTSFEIGNLSPQGALIVTHSQDVSHLLPGYELDLLFTPLPSPSGGAPNAGEKFRIFAEIRRIQEDVDPETLTITRRFGLSFSRITDADKAKYLDFLKRVLARLK